MQLLPSAPSERASLLRAPRGELRHLRVPPLLAPSAVNSSSIACSSSTACAAHHAAVLDAPVAAARRPSGSLHLAGLCSSSASGTSRKQHLCSAAAARPQQHRAARPQTACRVVQVDEASYGRGGRSDPMMSTREGSPSPESSGGAGGKSPEGYLALLGVAVLWGSYTPAIRLLYEIPTPPDPPLLNALQACLSAAFLVAANVTAGLTNTDANPKPYTSNPVMAEDLAVRQATIRRDRANRRRKRLIGSLRDWEDERMQRRMERMSPPPGLAPDPPRRPPSNALEKALSSALNWRTTNLTLAGAEVGLWMCLAFGLEVAGLQLTSATKVAFLNQVSVLITPLLVHLSGERVRGLEWVACGLGLLGSILVALDSLMSGGGGGHGHGGVDAGGPSNEVLGLIFVLVSSMFFALSTVRLGRYSSMFDPLKLSTTSTCTLGLLSLGWVAASILGRADGPAYEMEVINNMLASNSCILTLIWVGLGPGALAAYLQATGQKSVPPAQAQVIYSTTPLWAAGFAILALDASEEAMGSIAWVGAAVMLGSSLMTALLPPEDPQLAGAAAGAGSIQMPMSTFEESDSESEDDDDADWDDDRYSGRYLATELYVRKDDIYEEIDEEVRARQGLRDIF